ncbi:hypothetical protein MSAN_00432500 [Mycena sanguinolenta]|uniref:Uncharacterized protein n=1 Tax=Mycena sanguinolenta TaxID=230812 RepID=A0A8H7DLC4_9AGAR|nr:hypothetical protein MSAN_00432500 [Mycena sanguinolenta]
MTHPSITRSPTKLVQRQKLEENQESRGTWNERKINALSSDRQLHSVKLTATSSAHLFPCSGFQTSDGGSLTKRSAESTHVDLLIHNEQSPCTSTRTHTPFSPASTTPDDAEPQSKPELYMNLAALVLCTSPRTGATRATSQRTAEDEVKESCKDTKRLFLRDGGETKVKPHASVGAGSDNDLLRLR